MENNIKTVEIKYSDTMGKAEAYWHWFNCPNCNAEILHGDKVKYCSECGNKIKRIKDIELK